ncbi:MAG: DNA primase [Lachnospiraceae bacterium]|nr:DNA primase [Lachnospiraceae bacterium]
MFYSEDIIEDVRQQNDVVEVISSYVKLQKKGSNYMGLCPFHNEKSPSFSVSQSKQMYHCFGCGVGGNIFTFIMEYENYSFTEAVKYLAERAHITLPEGEFSEEEKRKADTKQSLLNIYKLAATYYYYQMYNSPKGKLAYDYLKGRNLSDETIKKFGLGYSNVSGGLYGYLKSKGYEDTLLNMSGLFSYNEKSGVYDKFWNRVMFPIMDVNNKVIGFGGRVMGDSKPKYLNSPETLLFDKSRNLFGMNIARTSRRRNIIICEGYMDVIALHQAGFNNAVASLGTALTGMQANLIKRYTESVLLTYDSDEAGVKAALRAIPILKDVGLTVKVIDMRPYKDPDEFIKNMGADAFEERINNATSWFDYETDALAKNYDLTDPESKTKFFNELAKKMLEFTEELERNNYAEAIARKYNIELKNFQKLINYYGAQNIVKSESINNFSKKDDKVNAKTDMIKEAQKLLLTWFVEEQRLFELLEGIITPDDFSDDLYKKAATILFSQYKESKNVVPAKIINAFESKEEQNEVALLFSTNIGEIVDNNGERKDFMELTIMERETYLNQLVKKIKLYSIEEQMRNSVDMSVFQQCSKQKAELQKMHITLGTV